jgi:hypothetical protein
LERHQRAQCSKEKSGAAELGSCLTDATREEPLPAFRSWFSRYAKARTHATAIVAARIFGGVIQALLI